MARNVFETAPRFNPHRQAVTVADSVTPTVAAAGVNGAGYERAIIEVRHRAGTFTSATIKVWYWSEAASKFIAESAEISKVLTTEAQFIIEHLGRTFWVGVSSLTGADLSLDINVAAAARQDGQG